MYDKWQRVFNSSPLNSNKHNVNNNNPYSDTVNHATSNVKTANTLNANLQNNTTPKTSYSTPQTSYSSLPTEVKPYFSPYTIFFRVPATQYHQYSTRVYEAALDYIQLYKDIIQYSKNNQNTNYTIPDKNLIQKRRETLHNYLDYRNKNDPAKNLLKMAFGGNWTEYALSNVFFPQDPN